MQKFQKHFSENQVKIEEMTVEGMQDESYYQDNEFKSKFVNEQEEMNASKQTIVLEEPIS